MTQINGNVAALANAALQRDGEVEIADHAAHLMALGAAWVWGREGDGIVGGAWDTTAYRLMWAGQTYLLVDESADRIVVGELFHEDTLRLAVA